ncbi:SIR2-domain-containing protein [Amylocystis lapponica]|nr:SIR2-domain-containing protein [Amylocystis lapponica]
MDAQAQPSARSSSAPRAGPSASLDKPRRSGGVYALQVQTFLDATEVVNADAEIIVDILDGFIGDVHGGGADDADEADARAPVSYEDEGEEEEDESDFDAFLQEAATAWTKAEVRQMTGWLKEAGMASFISEYVVVRAIPIPKLLYAFGVCLCKQLREKDSKTLLFFLRVALYHELESRDKLPQYNTIDDAVSLIRASKRILILTGAGISVSCGIPDFRSRNGLYATLQEKGEYELDDPQQMFDITYFRENPAGAHDLLSRPIYPSNFIPSPCHRFIKMIEDKGKLLRNYTQNIDTLETQAGVQRVLQCHGSFATASCLNCRIRVPGTDIEDDILNHRVPLCRTCNTAPIPDNPGPAKKSKKRRTSGWNSDESDEPDKPDFPPGIMKAGLLRAPDITFFGEKLNDVFDRSLLEDRQQLDLLIVIGTSLKVSPVSEMLASLPHSTPQILINRTPIKHINPDIVLLGNADAIVQHLCRQLGWILPEAPAARHKIDANPRANLKKRPSAPLDSPEPRRVGQSHVWVFEGAEGGKWLEELEERTRNDPKEIISDSGSDSEYKGPSVSSNARRKTKKARMQ